MVASASSTAVASLSSIAGRALRAVPRDLEGVFPPVFIALFFFIVNIATLSKLTQSAGLDRLLMTPIRRLAILLGHMVADVTVAMALTVPILTVGFAIGLRFETGVLGLLAFVVLAALWSLAFSGFGYAIALKTGNPAAVNSTFLLFFPFLFLTSSYVPRSQLSGWLDTVAGLNPVTYLLEGLRSLVSQGWQWDQLGKSLLAILLLGAISMSMCFAALRGRTKRG